MERLTGYQFLADLADFFLAFSDMFEGFKERSERVRELLGQPDSSFLLICAPEPASLSEAERFFQRLSSESLPIAGMIVNRVHIARGPETPPPEAADALTRIATQCDSGDGASPLIERLLLTHREQHDLAQADGTSIASTEVARNSIAIQRVPHFEHDLHSLEDIRAFADRLCNA